ncbi:MAG: beta-ketoacyl-[acyl-carrier-protein] synthase family protein [Verrucomicrobiota bacterium]
MGARFPVVTGLGIVAAPGCGADEIWNAITTGTSGLGPLTLFPSPRYGQFPIAEVRRDLLDLGAPAHGSRSDRLGWLAARQAIESAQLKNFDGDRAGVALGCSVGGSYDSEQFLTALIKHGKMRARPTRFHECCTTTDLVAESFGLFGPSTTVATACSSSALAIATAADMIVAGDADVMLAGGSDSVSRMTWGGFHSLLLVDAAGCRPFDATRAGMSLGEGAAVLVLEEEQSARRRGATILARLSGWGMSCDAFHATAPHPDGRGAVAAMQAALRRAGLTPAAIDYVNAHGTGTRDNDAAESRALKTVFGNNVPPYSSTKRFFGHVLGASGAIEALVCVEALRRGELPANLGFTTADPATGLQPLTALRHAPVRHVMSNSFGFGGNNAVLILSQPETAGHVVPRVTGPVAIAGVGVVKPGAPLPVSIAPPLPAGMVTAFACGDFAGPDELTATQRRRASRLAQMALVASKRSGPVTGRTAVVMGTGFGSLGEAAPFIENLIGKDEAEPMPARFINSVHNSPAAQVAMDLGAQALNSAPTMREISFESALWQGVQQLAGGEADTALVGAADELSKYVLSIGQRWGHWKGNTHPGEGAAVVRLANAGPAIAHVGAVRLGRYRLPFDARREAAWIAAAVDLKQIEVVLSGAGGWLPLDAMYAGVVQELGLEHQTYRQLCGDHYSASAFGFAEAVKLVQAGKRGVLLYTLAIGGGKAVCCVLP